MRLRDRVIGALNLFGSEDHRFAPDEVRVVQALADIATIGLLQQRSINDAEDMTVQLQAALNTGSDRAGQGRVRPDPWHRCRRGFPPARGRRYTRAQELTDVCAEVLEHR